MVVGSIPTVGDQDKIIISEMPGSDPESSRIGLLRDDHVIRSHHGGITRSHPNSEVKHQWACLVLRWGTTRESPVPNDFFFSGDDLNGKSSLVSIPSEMIMIWSGFSSEVRIRRCQRCGPGSIPG